ncbi:MAG TPA: MFS transporter [bacterium]|nr:MFS transporter [bacterium]
MNKKLLTYSSYFYLMSYAFTVTIIGPCNGYIDAAFNAGARTMGILISTHFAGFILTTIYAGYLVERTGIKPVMIGSIIVLGVSLIGFGQSKCLIMLFTAMFLTGVGGGAVESAVNALISRMYSETRVYNLNLLHVFFGIGAFLWPTIATGLLMRGVSWRTLYLFIGLFSILMALVMSLQKFPVMSSEGLIRLADIVDVAKRPTVVLLGGVIALYVGGEMGINAWVVRYFQEELGFVKADVPLIGVTLNAGFFLTLYWFTMTLGRLFVTIAGKYVADHILLKIVTTFSAVSAIAAFSVDNIFLAGFFLGLTGLFFSGIFATSIAIGGNRFPERVGIISGLIIAFSGIGNVFLNYSIGEIAQRMNSIRAGLLFVAVMLAGMAVCAFFVRSGKYPRDEIRH